MSADNYILVRKVPITQRALGTGEQITTDWWTYTMESASADAPRPIEGNVTLFSSRESAYSAAIQYENELEREVGFSSEYGIFDEDNIGMLRERKAQERSEMNDVVQSVVEQEQGKLWQKFWQMHDENHPVAMEDCFACGYDKIVEEDYVGIRSSDFPTSE